MKLTLRKKQTRFWDNLINPITGWEDSRKQEEYRFQAEDRLRKEKVNTTIAKSSKINSYESYI